MRKILLGFLFLFAAFSCISAEQSTLKIGTLHYNPPFEEEIDSSQILFGFDAEVMSSICHELKETCEFVPKRFDKLMKALDSHEVQAIIVGISLMPVHREKYLFSYPYFLSEAVFLTLKTTHMNSMDNKTVGVVKNTLLPFQKQIHLFYPSAHAMPLEEDHTIDLKFYPTLPKLFSALEHHEVQAILLDAGVANYWTSIHDSHYKQTGPIIQMNQGMSVMTTKNNQDLINEINQALLKMTQDRVLLNIYEQYWSAVIPEHRAQGYFVEESPSQGQIVIPKLED